MKVGVGVRVLEEEDRGETAVVVYVDSLGIYNVMHKFNPLWGNCSAYNNDLLLVSLEKAEVSLFQSDY